MIEFNGLRMYRVPDRVPVAVASCQIVPISSRAPPVSVKTGEKILPGGRYHLRMKRLVTYFLRGLAFVVPIAFTLWVFYAAFTTIDGWLGLGVPGLGVVVLVTATVLCGFLVSNLLTRRLMTFAERLLDRLPVAHLLHSSVKDLMSAFVGEKRKMGAPVLVSLDESGTLRTIGFVTRETLEAIGLTDHVGVYLPQSYNFAGQLLVVPRSRIQPIPGDGSAVMQFIVSGGIAGLGS